MPGDGTSEDMVAVILAVKQKINIRKLLSVYALFWHSDQFLTRFDKKIAKRIARK